MNESTVILTGVQINTPIYLGMKREYDFVHPMVDEFCRAAEFVPTPGEAPLHLVAGKGPFQRTVLWVVLGLIRTFTLFNLHNYKRGQFSFVPTTGNGVCHLVSTLRILTQ